MQKIISQVGILLIKVTSIIFIPFNNWKYLFLYKFTVTERFGATAHHVAAFFETCILKEVHMLYPVSQ